MHSRVEASVKFGRLGQFFSCCNKEEIPLNSTTSQKQLKFVDRRKHHVDHLMWNHIESFIIVFYSHLAWRCVFLGKDKKCQWQVFLIDLDLVLYYFSPEQSLGYERPFEFGWVVFFVPLVIWWSMVVVFKVFTPSVLARSTVGAHTFILGTDTFFTVSSAITSAALWQVQSIVNDCITTGYY